MTCIGVEKQLRLWRFLRDCEAVLGRDHDIGNAVSHQDWHAELAKMRPCSSIALPPRLDRLALSATESWWKGDGAARPHLGKLSMPVLVGNGIADVMVPAEHSFAIAQKAPKAKLLLYPDAGHAFLFQYTEDFCAEVLRFLGSLEAVDE